MSNAPIFGLPGPDEPKKIELIRRIRNKTQEGKIKWTRGSASFVARIGDGLDSYFTMDPSGTWKEFVLKSNGIPLIQTTYNPLVAILSFDPLSKEANELFSLISGGSRAIDQALRIVDGI